MVPLVVGRGWVMLERGGRRGSIFASGVGAANGVGTVEVEKVTGEVQSVTVIGRAPGMAIVVSQEGVAMVL